MKPFKAAWWLPNGNAQTIWASKIPRQSQVKYTYERFMLPDGDQTFVAWHPINANTELSAQSTTPIVVVLHGLEGSAQSYYAKGIMNEIRALGWHGVLLHFRGCHGGPNQVQRSYHSGDTADLQAFLTYLKQSAPNAPIYLVGYSLGGNVVLKYLGEQGSKSSIEAAVAVSVPFELSHAAAKLTQGFSQLYQHVLLSSLKQKFLDKFMNLPSPIDRTRVGAIKTIREFDDVVTAPLHGFDSADDYYSKSSCRQFLKSIETSTLILHANDDPLVPQSAIPNSEEMNESVSLECYANGGHVAFVAGGFNPSKPQYWLDSRIREFLQENHTP